jgi:preprotein translocase subunit SecA
LTEYKKEAFDLFEDMFERMKAAVVERLFKVQIVRDAPMELPAMTAWADARESRGEIAGEPARPATPAPRTQAVPRTPTGEKIGRNDPCFCGSGKKYKKCHYLKS